MALDIGARLGPYEVLGAIGAGGMGEVYKARDTRLNRTVALKILPSIWAQDPVMQQRFEREAKTIAGLNHPSICTLHDIGHEDATETSPPLDFLVMEYLEGETLSDRLGKGALPLSEALKIALAIGDALDKAHKQGVVHRDLKPSNVMLTKRGAKLLDFGLAKPGGVLQSVAALEGRSMLPTAANVTTPGTIVGTVQYMAPEQLEGREADARTDIFSFGVVLYEMLTGKKAFQGKSKTLLMSAILTSEPKPLSQVQPMSPASLDHLVRRCLAKDPEERWQTASDLLIQLRWVAGGGAPAGAGGAPARTRRQRVIRALTMAAAVLVAGLAFPAALLLWRDDSPAKFQFRSPVIGLVASAIALSPDGQTIAFVARPSQDEAGALYLRPVRSIASRRIAGTDDAAQPFWSADSRSIGFIAGGKLKRVEAASGSLQEITPAPEFFGGSWSSNGTILFGTSRGLMRVYAEGGTPEAVTTLDKNETGHLWPSFLPDGKHYLYLAWSGEAGQRGIFAAALDSKDRKKVMPAESNAVYASPGYMVFHRDAAVFAQRFDPEGIERSGEAFHLADGVGYNPATGRGSFDVSQTGALIYFQGAGSPLGRAQAGNNVQLGWVAPDGTVQAPAGEAGVYGDFDLSPDGKQIAVTRQDTGAAGADIWVIDWQSGANETPLTRDPADDLNPVWSHDGKRVAFTTYRKGNADVYVRNANGVGTETPLLESTANEMVEGWSRDGRYLLYLSGPDEAQDIYALPLSADAKPDGKPILLVTGKYQKNEPQLSYDDKLLAYSADESGSFEVYVMWFPDGLDKAGRDRRKVSKNGGGQPRWRRDGKELYYRRAVESGIMAVEIRLGATIEASVPRFLFAPFLNGVPARSPTRHMLSVNAEGTRFLMRVPNNVAGGGTSRGTWAFVGGQRALIGPGRGGRLGRVGLGRGGERARGGGPGNSNQNGLVVELNWTTGLGNTKK